MNSQTAQKLCFFTLFFLALACSADAQGKTAEERSPQSSTDETFTLNITESRTNEVNYERSTQVEIGGAQDERAIQLRVGAAVRAQNVVIILRGITGNVRFRASLEKIRRRLE